MALPAASSRSTLVSEARPRVRPSPSFAASVETLHEVRDRRIADVEQVDVKRKLRTLGDPALASILHAEHKGTRPTRETGRSRARRTRLEDPRIGTLAPHRASPRPPAAWIADQPPQGTAKCPTQQVRRTAGGELQGLPGQQMKAKWQHLKCLNHLARHSRTVQSRAPEQICRPPCSTSPPPQAHSKCLSALGPRGASHRAHKNILH